MIKIVSALFLSSALLFASPKSSEILKDDFRVTLDWLETKPTSFAKDFYIIQYLNQDNLSYEEIEKAYSMANPKNYAVKKLYNKKYLKIPPEDLKCYRASIDELMLENSRCIALGLSIKESTTISKEKLNILISKLDKNYPTLKKDLEVINNLNPFYALINSDVERFYRIFFSVSDKYILENFDKLLEEKFLLDISSNKNFEKFVKTVIYKQSFKNIEKSFLNIKNIKDLNSDILFLLALNALNNDRTDLSFNYLLEANQKAYFKKDKDKTLFWLYLTTDNKSFLYELSKSWDINIYSVYAKELLFVPIDNIIYNVDLLNKPSSFDIFDQFKWNEVLDDVKNGFDEIKLQKYYNIFTDEDTKPHLVYLLEKYNKQKLHYFITPYFDIVSKFDKYKQVLMYSLARQESKFIPCSISTSTAQGVMQIMPFLSEDIAKKIGDNYNIYEQFVPQKNIEYANFHIDVLGKQFSNNPLFIAYAYNGGAGYLKKELNKGLFKNKNKFEPFRSMEMLTFEETREYGKKVLTNYYIYNNYLNPENKISLSSIFETLIYYP